MQGIPENIFEHPAPAGGSGAGSGSGGEGTGREDVGEQQPSQAAGVPSQPAQQPPVTQPSPAVSQPPPAQSQPLPSGQVVGGQQSAGQVGVPQQESQGERQGERPSL